MGRSSGCLYRKFSSYFSIDNKDAFLMRLEMEKPEAYERYLKGERVMMKLKLNNVNSVCYYQSEYYNSLDFIDFID